METLVHKSGSRTATVQPAASRPAQVKSQETLPKSQSNFPSPSLLRFADSGISAQKTQPESSFASQAKIQQRQGPEDEAPGGAGPGSDCPIKEKYTVADIETAAWKIMQGEQSVRDAFLFFSRIKTTVDQSKWNEELAKFFVGEYKPRTRLKSLNVSGETPTHQLGRRKHKRIRIKAQTRFSIAVASYLHEMVHYADLWYSSKAAPRDRYRPSADAGKGITPVSPGDLSKPQQVAAMGEYLTVTVKQILIDMQKAEPQPFEHPCVPDERRRFDKAKKEKSFKLDKYLRDTNFRVTADLKEIYAALGLAPRGGKQNITGTNVELGFAFEKAAYGVAGSKEGEWVIGFNEKFETSYCKYLQ